MKAREVCKNKQIGSKKRRLHECCYTIMYLDLYKSAICFYCKYKYAVIAAALIVFFVGIFAVWLVNKERERNLLTYIVWVVESEKI